MIAMAHLGEPKTTPPRRGASSMWASRYILGAFSVAVLVVTARQYSISIMKTKASPDVLAEIISFLVAETGKDSSSSVQASPFYHTSQAQRLGENRPKTEFYHVVFSTACTPLQNWQSYLLFFSAMKVGQSGNVTRIASGCKPEEMERLITFHARYIRPMSNRFHIHFTPDFSTVRLESGKRPFKYMNKPYGVRHWMEHKLGINGSSGGSPASIPQQFEDDIVMLLDPDMVLLRPLRHNFSDEEVLWVEGSPGTKVVRHGYPISQQDGYLDINWMDLNWSYITNRSAGLFVEPPPRHDGERIWIAGPPYLATVKDMYHIAELWTRYSPRVLDIFPHIFAEMVGWIIASVQLKLPHSFVKSIVVSEVGLQKREGWAYVDRIPDDRICETDGIPMPRTAPMPIGLHYCQRYMLGEFFFSKYRVKKNILECEQPLYKLPPKDLLKRYNYSVVPMRGDRLDEATWVEIRKPVSRERAKREAFMLCQLMSYLNEAARYHKQRACPGLGNFNETLSVYLDPLDY